MSMQTEIPSDRIMRDDALAEEAKIDGLVARGRIGDRDGFQELMAMTEPRIRRLLGRLACRGSDLDDLVQETYFRAWKSLGRFRGESQFSTWLARIATNVASTWRKSRKPLLTLTDQSASTIRVEEGFAEQPLMAAYERALQALSPDLRAVFILHETEGMSYRDVAETLGCPLGTVMSRLHRARTKILDELRERLEELSP